MNFDEFMKSAKIITTKIVFGDDKVTEEVFELCKEMGLAAKRRHIFNNGGLDSRLLEFEIYNSKGNKDIAFE